MDAGEMAEKLGEFLTSFSLAHPGITGEGWDFYGLDIGEVQVTTPDGLKFRLTVEELAPGESFD